MRDSQRSKVYKADSKLVAVSRKFADMEETEKFARKVMKSERLKKALGYMSHALKHDIVVKDGRGRRSAGGWAGGITMPTFSRNEAIVCHELAHTLCMRLYRRSDIAGHGWQFCSMYLLIVRCVMGRQAAKTLQDAFKEYRVKYRAPRKNPKAAERMKAWHAAKRNGQSVESPVETLTP
jgi:putative metallohydrolase (TIGR04338 family)